MGRRSVTSRPRLALRLARLWGAALAGENAGAIRVTIEYPMEAWGAALKAPARSSDTRIDELQACAPRRPHKRTGGRGGDIGCRPPARADVAGSGMFDRQAVRRTGASPRTGRLRVAWREVEHRARNRESGHLGGRGRERATDVSGGRGARGRHGRAPAASTVLGWRRSE